MVRYRRTGSPVPTIEPGDRLCLLPGMTGRACREQLGRDVDGSARVKATQLTPRSRSPSRSRRGRRRRAEDAPDAATELLRSLVAPGRQSLAGIRPDSSWSHGEATCLPAPRKQLPRGPTPPRLREWPKNGHSLRPPHTPHDRAPAANHRVWKSSNCGAKTAKCACRRPTRDLRRRDRVGWSPRQGLRGRGADLEAESERDEDGRVPRLCALRVLCARPPGSSGSRWRSRTRGELGGFDARRLSPDRIRTQAARTCTRRATGDGGRDRVGWFERIAELGLPGASSDWAGSLHQRIGREP
jgi:hypothetical protein